MSETANENEKHETPAPVRETYAELPTKHSGLGITSFVLGAVSVLGMLTATNAATSELSKFVDENGKPALPEDRLVEELEPLMGVLLLFPLISLISFVGLILGVVALTRRDRKRLFSVLGVVLNGLHLLLILLMIVLALAVS